LTLVSLKPPPPPSLSPIVAKKFFPPPCLFSRPLRFAAVRRLWPWKFCLSTTNFGASFPPDARRAPAFFFGGFLYPFVCCPLTDPNSTSPSYQSLRAVLFRPFPPLQISLSPPGLLAGQFGFYTMHSLVFPKTCFPLPFPPPPSFQFMQNISNSS